MRNLTMIGCSVIVLALAGCSSEEKSDRGLKYMPEMYDTPAYKSQSAMERTDADGKTVRHIPMMLTPPVGSIPRTGAPYQIDALDFASAKELVNPLLPTAAVLKSGQRWFNITCAACHGVDGNAANASVAPTKNRPLRFGGVPSLNGTNVVRLSDGEIFHLITRGRARMPSLHAQVLPEERWAVVHYLRALNRATLALTDSEQQLKDLEKGVAAGYAQVTPEAKGELDALRLRVAQRRVDLALIQSGGDGADFAPPKPARPEYEQAAWPDKSEK